MYSYRGDKPGIVKGHRADVPAALFDASKCGTYAGYHRHRRYGVPACQSCADANRAYTAKIRADRKVPA